MSSRHFPSSSEYVCLVHTAIHISYLFPSRPITAHNTGCVSLTIIQSFNVTFIRISPTNRQQIATHAYTHAAFAWKRQATRDARMLCLLPSMCSLASQRKRPRNANSHVDVIFMRSWWPLQWSVKMKSSVDIKLRPNKVLIQSCHDVQFNQLKISRYLFGIASGGWEAS